MDKNRRGIATRIRAKRKDEDVPRSCRLIPQSGSIEMVDHSIIHPPCPEPFDPNDAVDLPS